MPLVKERGTHPKVRLLDLLKHMAQVDETTIGRGFKYADGANHLQATLGGGPSAKCLVDDDSVRPKFPGQCDSGGFTGVKPFDAFDGIGGLDPEPGRWCRDESSNCLETLR